MEVRRCDCDTKALDVALAYFLYIVLILNGEIREDLSSFEKNECGSVVHRSVVLLQISRRI